MASWDAWGTIDASAILSKNRRSKPIVLVGAKASPKTSRSKAGRFRKTPATNVISNDCEVSTKDGGGSSLTTTAGTSPTAKPVLNAESTPSEQNVPNAGGDKALVKTTQRENDPLAVKTREGTSSSIIFADESKSKKGTRDCPYRPDGDEGEYGVELDQEPPLWAKDACGQYKGEWGCSSEELENLIQSFNFGENVHFASIDMCRTHQRPDIRRTGIILVCTNPTNAHWVGVAIDCENQVYARVGCSDVPIWITEWLTSKWTTTASIWDQLSDVSPKLGKQTESECGALVALVFQWFVCTRNRVLKVCDADVTTIHVEAEKCMGVWRVARQQLIGGTQKSDTQFAARRLHTIAENESKNFLTGIGRPPVW